MKYVQCFANEKNTQESSIFKAFTQLLSIQASFLCFSNLNAKTWSNNAYNKQNKEIAWEKIEKKFISIFNMAGNTSYLHFFSHLFIRLFCRLQLVWDEKGLYKSDLRS